MFRDEKQFLLVLHTGNCDSIRWVASSTTVEVVLLDIDTVVGDPGQNDILVNDILDRSRGVGVGLDSTSILAVGDCRVGEGDP